MTDMNDSSPWAHIKKLSIKNHLSDVSCYYNIKHCKYTVDISSLQSISSTDEMCKKVNDIQCVAIGFVCPIVENQ